MDIVERTIRAYDAIAPDYCSKTRRETLLDLEGEYIEKLISYLSAPIPLILDVGCADGRHCAIIDRLGGRSIGIDLSDSMLKEATSYFPEGDYRKMDQRRLLFGDDHFDGIWSSGSIYHVTKAGVAAVIAEFARVLKPGGVVAVNFKLGDGEGMDQRPRSYDELPRYFAYYTKGEMTSLFRASGFEELSSTTFPQRIYGDDIQQMWFGPAGSART